MTSHGEEQPVAALADNWRQEFIHVMEAMADSRPEMEPSGSGKDAPGAGLWWKQSLNAAQGAVVWVGTPEETWVSLGRRILTAAGIDSASAEEMRSSYLEVLRQSLSAFASGIGAELRRDVTCTDGSEEAPPERTTICSVSIRMDGEILPALSFAASRELVDALSRSRQPEAATSAGPASDSPAADLAEDDSSQRVFNTLDLLLDVEMPVSVSFGRTQVRIQDILKLITGSIIELDRAISEPVEVIVNNCVIARGEVVVVEGNYGVRINEVMSRQQRLQESRRYLLPVSHRH